MGCLLALVVVGFPRVVLILMWFFSNALERAYHGLLVPVLGFFFLPITTVVYAWMVTSGLPMQGINVLIIIVAVILDMGAHSGGAGYYRRRF